MKILLLAYACEPNRGSEPGIGWKWAVNLCLDSSKEVYVLTRENNKPVIETYAQNNTIPKNLHVYYYDLPRPLIWAKKHGLPINIYYGLWLYYASYYAYNLHQKIKFDMAHHITFGVFRDASCLYRLNIPYVVGPLGGGEYTPKQLLKIYSKSYRLKEHIRRFANNLSLLNPLLHKTLNRSDLILTKTQDTKNVLKKWANKINIQLEIGINEIKYSDTKRQKQQFLYVGRFIELKGIYLILNAFLRYKAKHPKAELFLIGKGELQPFITAFIKEKELENNIHIIHWLKQEELALYYQTTQVMLFPSLHDSSGNVVLEAISNGLPTICLDCGGPVSVLGKRFENDIVKTGNKNVNEIIDDIVEKMEKISSDENYFHELQNKGYQRAEEFLWTNTVNNTYKIIQSHFIKRTEQ